MAHLAFGKIRPNVIARYQQIGVEKQFTQSFKNHDKIKAISAMNEVKN